MRKLEELLKDCQKTGQTRNALLEKLEEQVKETFIPAVCNAISQLGYSRLFFKLWKNPFDETNVYDCPEHGETFIFGIDQEGVFSAFYEYDGFSEDWQHSARIEAPTFRKENLVVFVETVKDRLYELLEERNEQNEGIMETLKMF